MPAVVSISGSPPPWSQLEPVERNAFRVLAEAGLIAPFDAAEDWLDDSDWDADLDLSEYRAGYA